MTLKENIRKQIENFPKGIIFVLDDLNFKERDRASVTSFLSMFKSKGFVRSAGKGLYYRPKISFLGEDPISQTAIIDYYMRECKGYVSGGFLYNAMGLTTQVPTVISIATKVPRRQVVLPSIKITFVKSYVDKNERNEKVIYIIDAVKDANNIPGTTKKDILKCLQIRIDNLSSKEKQILCETARNYPPATKFSIAGMLSDNYSSLILDSIRPDTLRKLRLKNG